MEQADIPKASFAADANVARDAIIVNLANRTQDEHPKDTVSSLKLDYWIAAVIAEPFPTA